MPPYDQHLIETFGPLESDPEGRPANTPGAKLDAGKPRPGLVMLGFARALKAVAHVGTFGATKYSDNGWMAVPNGEARYTDAMLRHLLAEGSGEELDRDSGLPHAAHLAWNALARLDLYLRCVEAEQNMHATDIPNLGISGDAASAENSVRD